MRIGEPARKHGIADEDMRHAIRNVLRGFETANSLMMIIGPARDGMLLEVGILGVGSDDPVILHAMKCRKRFYSYL